jgi:ATP-dependent RNA helicase SUPV3L1/SUV3
MLAGVGEDGSVTVEGHFVGKLAGVRFELAHGGSVLEDKALRAAAAHAIGPEMTRRLGKLAAEADEAFAVDAQGSVLWRGEVAGVIAGGEPFRPRVRLLGEVGPEAARERAARRLEAFVAAEAGRRLWPLRRLQDAIAGGELRGLARGLAYQLHEAGGLMDRAPVRAEAKALSQVERRTLRALGVKLGAFSIYMPALLKPGARELAQAFIRREGAWRPLAGVSRLPEQQPTPRLLAAFGLRAVRHLAVPVEQLEDLDEALRANAGVLIETVRKTLGWGADETQSILRGLGFTPVKGKADAWRRRPEPEQAKPAKPLPASPFAALAALAALQAQPTPARRKRRRPKAKRAAGTSAS